jgi:hypothetical protein
MKLFCLPLDLAVSVASVLAPHWAHGSVDQASSKHELLLLVRRHSEGQSGGHSGSTVRYNSVRRQSAEFGSVRANTSGIPEFHRPDVQMPQLLIGP